MKSASSIALLLIIMACSKSGGFKGDVATGSAKNEPVVKPAVTPGPKTVDGAGAPKPPLLDACKSTAAKSVEETISFAENAKGCEFGQGINMARKDGTVTAVETTTASLKLPAGRICEMGLETSSSTQMRYDDMMAFAIDANLVFASTRNILQFLEMKSNVYAWDPLKLIGKAMEFTGKADCIGGADSCVIPPTDEAGPFSVKIPPEKFEPISIAITGKSEIPVTLSVTGDNDDSDCSHSAVNMKVTIKYIP